MKRLTILQYADLTAEQKIELGKMFVSHSLNEWTKEDLDGHTPKQIIKLTGCGLCFGGRIFFRVIEKTSKYKKYAFYCHNCKKKLAEKKVIRIGRRWRMSGD